MRVAASYLPPTTLDGALMTKFRLKNVSKQYPGVLALHPTSLDIEDGEFITLLGPSGCGKTTLLRIVAGLVEPTAGVVEFDGRDITRLPPQKRSLGMVFQDYALFPHLTISENIGFGLRERGYPRAEIQTRIAELLALIKLPGIAERLPVEISGGQQQRVAFARAIAHPPQLLLMDEPLGALDLKLREAMQLELRQLQRQLGITTLYVTHDQSEAMCLSDRIAVMNNGRLEQIGTAREIYDRPNSLFVAQFVGRINLLRAEPAGREGTLEVLKVGDCEIRSRSGRNGTDAGCFVAVRPHNLAIVNGTANPERDNRIGGRVISQVFNGNLLHIQVEVGDAVWTVETRPHESDQIDGSEVTLCWRADDTILLDG